MSGICIIEDCSCEGTYEIYNPSVGQYAWICEEHAQYVPQINGYNASIGMNVSDEEVAWAMEFYNHEIHADGITEDVKENLTDRQIEILEAYRQFTTWTPYDEEE